MISNDIICDDVDFCDSMPFDNECQIIAWNLMLSSKEKREKKQFSFDKKRG